MTKLGMMAPATLDRFRELCGVVTARGGGILATEIDDCAALAREEARDAPDAERLEELRERLGLDGEGP